MGSNWVFLLVSFIFQNSQKSLEAKCKSNFGLTFLLDEVKNGSSCLQFCSFFFFLTNVKRNSSCSSARGRVARRLSSERSLRWYWIRFWTWGFLVIPKGAWELLRFRKKINNMPIGREIQHATEKVKTVFERHLFASKPNFTLGFLKNPHSGSHGNAEPLKTILADVWQFNHSNFFLLELTQISLITELLEE